jgi:hypothetical protein
MFRYGKRFPFSVLFLFGWIDRKKLTTTCGERSIAIEWRLDPERVDGDFEKAILDPLLKQLQDHTRGTGIFLKTVLPKRDDRENQKFHR